MIFMNLERTRPGEPTEIVTLEVIGRLSFAWYKKITVNCGERKTKLFVVNVPEAKQYGFGIQLVIGEQCFVLSVHTKACRNAHKATG